VKKLILGLWLTWGLLGGAADSVLKPEAQKRIEKNLAVLAENTDRAKQNLAAAIHNVDVLNGELSELDRLQREHEALKAKYRNIDLKGPDGEKAKALLKGIDEGLGQIQIQRAPLQKQIIAWKERQVGYEAKLAEFEKKREELGAPPSSQSSPTEN
jgi:chromosome segregation ATPase